MDYYLAGALLRGAQVVIDASIWIAFGCFIAAIFKNMIGPQKTRTLFGDGTRYGLLIGWGIGMVLPVCSLGVIPVVRELNRIGVKSGTIIAFGLTAPLFNPLSILYGLSMSDPVAIIIFSFAAMVIVTGLGALWGKIFDKKEAAENDEAADEDEKEDELPSTGIRRSLAVIHDASSELVGKSMVFIIIGVLVSTAIATMVPHGSLQTKTEPDQIFAPAFMACYVTPVYSTPLLAMSQIGGMFQHGNSIGAAFSLLVLGAGVNVGFLCWFASAFGLRRATLFLLLLWALTISIAYGLDKPLYPKGVSPHGHTHAFDVYTHPFQKSGKALTEKAWLEAQEYYKDRGYGAPVFLLAIAIIGGVFRLVDSKTNLRSWYVRPRKNEESGDWDIALPPWVIGLVACVCLVVVSIAGAYMYYPAPEDVLGDLGAINNNCVIAAKTRDWEGVSKWVLFCDDLSRRLEVGVFLRRGHVSEFQKAKAKVYRDLLDELRDNIEMGQTENASEQAMDVHRAYLQLSDAFRKKPEK